MFVAFRMPFDAPPFSETFALSRSVQSSDLMLIVTWLGVVPFRVSGTLNLTFPITSLHCTRSFETSIGGGAAACATGAATTAPSPAASATVLATARNFFLILT